jgi:predicted nucleic acid-binding protein
LIATILLDTSVIVDHLNRRYGRSAYLDQLIAQGYLLACCPVNITEVYAGLRPGEESKTEAFLDSLECLSVTPAIAKLAGLLRRDWQKKGQTLSYSDVTIAAVALSNQIPLLTDNLKHFPMPELQLLPLPNHSEAPEDPVQRRP